MESVAPREVVDLLYRASRVQGCDSSAADRVAAEVTFCEIHHGGGLAAWTALINDASKCLVESVRSSYQIDLMAARARSEGVGRVVWEPSILFAIVARSLHYYGRLGLRWAGAPVEPIGTDSVSTMELSLTEGSEFAADVFAERSRTVLVEGLLVDRLLWSRLDQAAAGFLLSEAILDEVVDSNRAGTGYG